jgi:hypothetical protein
MKWIKDNAGKYINLDHIEWIKIESDPKGFCVLAENNENYYNLGFFRTEIEAKNKIFSILG